MYKQIHGSIKHYFYKRFPEAFLYHEKLPEQLRVPSMYFPQLPVNDAGFSKDGFSLLYTVRVHLFLPTRVEAVMKAEDIANSIRMNRYKIPLLDVTGKETGQYISFQTISTADIDNGAAQVTMIVNDITLYTN